MVQATGFKPGSDTHGFLPRSRGLEFTNGGRATRAGEDGILIYERRPSRQLPSVPVALSGLRIGAAALGGRELGPLARPVCGSAAPLGVSDF